MLYKSCLFFNVDFSLFRPLEFFVDPKNGDGRNNNPPAMVVMIALDNGNSKINL